MRVGDLVYIGWSGKDQSPFIGIITETYEDCCWVYVNGKFQWCGFDNIKKV